MHLDKKLILAFDTSCAHGMVIAFNGDNIIFEKTLSDKLSHGKYIVSALEEALSASSSELAGLMVGLGPGSFIGLRIALATALGFSFARSLPLMGFCSHRAISESFSEYSSKWIITKASGDLSYLSFFNEQGQQQETQVEDYKQALAKITPGSLVISDIDLRQECAERGLLFRSTHGPSALGIITAAYAKLKDGLLDESQIIKPNYIKNPNVSLPKKSFVNLSFS